MASKNKKLQEILNNTFGISEHAREGTYRCQTTVPNQSDYCSKTPGIRSSYEYSALSPMIDQSKRPRIDLLVKPKSILLAGVMAHGTERIKKEISVLNKDFTKDGVPNGKFRNRPVLNMTRRDLDFSSRHFASESYMKKESLVGASKKKKTASVNSFIKSDKLNIIFNPKENSEFIAFMKEMTTMKKKMLVK